MDNQTNNQWEVQSETPVHASQAPASASQTQPAQTAPQWEVASETPVDQQNQPGILDREIPLTSHTNATLSGMQSVGRGVRDAVTGTMDMFSPPKDKAETAIATLGSPIALPIYRTLRGAGHSVKDSAQIVAAIHDINASPDPVGTYAKAAQETAGQGAGQALTALAAEGILKVTPAAARAAVDNTVAAYKNTKGLISTKALQEPLQAGVRSALEDVADDAGVTRPSSPSIRKVVEETADQIYAKSKAQYQVLDEATGGRFQRFREKLEAGRKQLMNLSGSEEDVAKEASILKGQHETELAMQDAFEDARAKGVDPKLIDEANGDFRKSQALYDLDVAIKRATEGAHPGVSTPELLEDSPETIDPRKLHARVNSLFDSGRLQDALGEKGANDLFDHTLENSAAQSKILRNRSLAMTAGKYGAATLGLGTVGHYVGHMLE